MFYLSTLSKFGQFIPHFRMAWRIYFVIPYFNGLSIKLETDRQVLPPTFSWSWPHDCLMNTLTSALKNKNPFPTQRDNGIWWGLCVVRFVTIRNFKVEINLHFFFLDFGCKDAWSIAFPFHVSPRKRQIGGIVAWSPKWLWQVLALPVFLLAVVVQNPHGGANWFRKKWGDWTSGFTERWVVLGI